MCIAPHVVLCCGLCFIKTFCVFLCKYDILPLVDLFSLCTNCILESFYVFQKYVIMKLSSLEILE